MARINYNGLLKVLQTATGRTTVLVGSGAPVTTVTTTTYDTDAVTAAAAIATAVALGASPTQASVTAISSAYTALATAYTAMKAQITALSPETGDIYVSINLANVTTANQLRSLFDAMIRQFKGNSLFSGFFNN